MNLKQLLVYNKLSRLNKSVSALFIEFPPKLWLGSWRKIQGSVLLAISSMAYLAIFSYHANDTSLNHASMNPVGNISGRWGAVFADLAIQTFGYASLVLITMCTSSGLILLFKKEQQRFWLLRLSIILTMLPILAAVHATFGKGGYVGVFIWSEAQEFLSPQHIKWLGWVIIAAIYTIALGLTPREWYAVCKFCGKWIMGVSLFMIWMLRASYVILVRLWTKLRPRHDDQLQEAWSMPKMPNPIIEVAASKNKHNKKPIQPELALALDNYIFPKTNLLRDPPAYSRANSPNEGALSQNSKLLQQVLQDFGVNGIITKIHPGPVVTLYELEPAAGTKSSRVIGLADDIARSMSAVSARIAVMPGRNALGIELPNAHREMVYLRELLETQNYRNTEAQLPLILGKNISGEPVIADLARMPHLLVAGTTGSGKSVAINTMILSLLFKYSPKECQLIMIDPKMLELSVYEGIPHLLAPVVTEPKKAVSALKWVVKEMENRYRAMSSIGVRNIMGYNKMIDEAKTRGEKLTRSIQTGFNRETGQPLFELVEMASENLPLIVVVVDEMADLMVTAGKDIECLVQRLAQMARAAGIHIIMATQRPSVDVITGVIKANFPTRISFQVTSKIDSRTILGEQGAEQLLGMGDMLFMVGGGRIERVHGPFVGDKEVEEVVRVLKTNGQPLYRQDITSDDEDSNEPDTVATDTEGSAAALYDQAVAIILRDKRPTTSYLQRCLKIGYNKAASLIEEMEKRGVLSEPNSLGKRHILADEG